MILVSYDISSDRLRSEFSKYIKQYGYRVQFSLYQIKNSKRHLNNIMNEIKMFEKRFSQSDSVLIINSGLNADVIKFGYAKNDEDDIIFI